MASATMSTAVSTIWAMATACVWVRKNSRGTPSSVAAAMAAAQA